MKRALQVGIVLLVILAGFIGMINLTTENALAGTAKSGTISFDETWDLAGSPYWIEGDVTVDSGATLTIDPGVQVKFNGLHSIYVDGALNAVGSAVNRINFTSNSTTPSWMDWDRIEINSGGKAEIKYCEISYGLIGLHISGSSNNNITYNRISNNFRDGIYLTTSLNNTITNNTISSNREVGINMWLTSNSRISFNNITNNMNGISTWASHNNLISNNSIISNNETGIELVSSLNNTIINNTFLNDGVFINGGTLPRFNTHTIPMNNIVNGKPLHYYKDCNGIDINGMQVGQIILANCTNVNLWNMQIKNTDVGFEAAYSENISISYNNLSSNDMYSIYAYYTSNATIQNNNVSDNDNEGIVLVGSSNITITNNTVSSNYKALSGWEYGIRLYSSSNNTIRNNTVSKNDGGISIGVSSNNTVANNSVSLNSVYGIYLESSSNNLIFHNNIIDNSIQAFDEPSGNVWNQMYPSGGNYWSDYSPACADNSDGATTPQTGGGGPDGICDNRYDIDVDSIDYYPHKYPVGSPDINGPSISNLLPMDLSTTSDYKPTISADYGDPAGIDISSVSLEVDGNDVTSSATVTASGVAYSPSAPLADGSHDVYLEVRDNLGNQATKTWSFTVDTSSPSDTSAPSISGLRPADMSTVNHNAPAIGADFSDDTGINVTSVVVKVNGNDVTALATITAGGVSYTPTSSLSDGIQTVYIEVKDNSTNQNEANVTWSFTIDTSETNTDGDFLSDYWWLILLVIIVVVVLVVMLMLMRKKKPLQSEPSATSEASESASQPPSEN